MKIQSLSYLIVCFGLVISNFSFANNAPEVSTEYAIVVKDNSIVLETLKEDALSATNTTIELLSKAELGNAIVNDDLTITYQPNEGICDEIDKFSYSYTDAEGTHVVHVSIEILCESLTIISGFSPDDEEEPFTFTIIGIENFPDNSLYIFDSNGNEIYNKKGYMNEWDGKDHGEPLPRDYVYYYVFNDGEGGTHSGYVNIN